MLSWLPAASWLPIVVLAMSSGCASRSAAVDGAGAASPVGDRASGRIVAIHRSKCGACHTPVEPGSLHRDEAETALQRHRRRAKLSEQEWDEMVDYLSDSGRAHLRPTARVP